MAINGVELQLNQIWENRAGDFIRLTGFKPGGLFEWMGIDGSTYQDKGRISYFNDSEGDLIKLIAQKPRYNYEDPTVAGDSTQATTFGPLDVEACTGVGDINSDAKGSGARFNTGKVPYELVPLELMAIHYEQLIMLDLPMDNTPCTPHEATQALLCLGQFQARRSDSVLVDVLTEMGDGWEDCARVFDYGRKKYKEFNWAKGMAWSIPIACAARHLQAIINGEQIDGDKVIDGKLVEGSNLPHRGHVYANISMLYTFMETYLEGDDRPPPGMLALNEAEVAL